MIAKQPIGFAPKQETTAVFVRVPVGEAEKLDRLSFELKRPKREIVTALLSAVDLEGGRMVLGHADVQREAHDHTEVLTLEELAELLQVDEGVVHALAERGELPGRQLGGCWRFSRRAVLEWLACA